jgi:hypothetical protein
MYSLLVLTIAIFSSITPIKSNPTKADCQEFEEAVMTAEGEYHFDIKYMKNFKIFSPNIN